MQRRSVTRFHALPSSLSHSAQCYITTYIAAFGLLMRNFNIAILHHCPPTNNPCCNKISCAFALCFAHLQCRKQQLHHPGVEQGPQQG